MDGGSRRVASRRVLVASGTEALGCRLSRSRSQEAGSGARSSHSCVRLTCSLVCLASAHQTDRLVKGGSLAKKDPFHCAAQFGVLHQFLRICFASREQEWRQQEQPRTQYVFQHTWASKQSFVHSKSFFCRFQANFCTKSICRFSAS